MSRTELLDRLESAGHEYLVVLNDPRHPLRHVLLVLLRRRIGALECALKARGA